MNILVIAVVILFVSLGIIHFYWALGGKAGIIKAIPTIDGNPTMRPGAFITALVGISLVVIGCITYLLWFLELDSLPLGKYIGYIGWVLSGVFIIRSIGDINVIGFFKKVKSSEFAKYDTLIYSPLCLILGIFFAAISYHKS